MKGVSGGMRVAAFSASRRIKIFGTLGQLPNFTALAPLCPSATLNLDHARGDRRSDYSPLFQLPCFDGVFTYIPTPYFFSRQSDRSVEPTRWFVAPLDGYLLLLGGSTSANHGNYEEHVSSFLNCILPMQVGSVTVICPPDDFRVALRLPLD